GAGGAAAGAAGGGDGGGLRWGVRGGRGWAAPRLGTVAHLTGVRAGGLRTGRAPGEAPRGARGRPRRVGAGARQRPGTAGGCGPRAAARSPGGGVLGPGPLDVPARDGARTSVGARRRRAAADARPDRLRLP